MCFLFLTACQSHSSIPLSISVTLNQKLLWLSCTGRSGNQWSTCWDVWSRYQGREDGDAAVLSLWSSACIHAKFVAEVCLCSERKHWPEVSEHSSSSWSSFHLRSSLIPTSPLELPSYGVDSIQVLAQHYFPDQRDRLLAEWNILKYHMKEMAIPADVKEGKTIMPAEWCMSQLMKQRSTFTSLLPLLMNIVEIALTMPISNAWPEGEPVKWSS